MIVVAGPIASGKTTRFRQLQEQLRIDSFNVDDRAARLNGADTPNYRDIPKHVDAQARGECEVFVRQHIDEGRSFLVETTLRTQVSIEQARHASTAGFRTEMVFVALDDVEKNIDRAFVRQAGGGRNADEQTIRDSHRAAMGNLPDAMREFHHVTVIDNSGRAGEPGRVVLEVERGDIVRADVTRGDWVHRALQGTEFQPQLEERARSPRDEDYRTHGDGSGRVNDAPAASSIARESKEPEARDESKPDQNRDLAPQHDHGYKPGPESRDQATVVREPAPDRVDAPPADKAADRPHQPLQPDAPERHSERPFQREGHDGEQVTQRSGESRPDPQTVATARVPEQQSGAAGGGRDAGGQSDPLREPGRPASSGETKAMSNERLSERDLASDRRAELARDGRVGGESMAATPGRPLAASPDKGAPSALQPTEQATRVGNVQTDNSARFQEALAALRQQNDRFTRAAEVAGGATKAAPAAQALELGAKLIRSANPEMLKQATERPEKAALETAKTAVRVAAIIKPPLAAVVKPIEKISDTVQKNIDRSNNPSRER